MDRRTLFLGLSALPFVGSARAAETWKAQFVQGDFDGTAYQAGLHVTMDEGWKTYWRNPGETGIPPSITAAGDNLESLRIDFPLPQRNSDASGEAIGFHNEVLFPLYLKPKNPNKPIAAKLAAFFGVCDQICQPAKLDQDLAFMPASSTNDQALIAKWQGRVPQQGSIASAATIKNGHLVLGLTAVFDDIFVEGPERFYFRKPDFTREPGKAWIKIDGLKRESDLKGADLRITADKAGKGLEQHSVLA